MAVTRLRSHLVAVPAPTPLGPLLDTAERLSAEFAASAAVHDRTGAFPADNFRRLDDAGLLAVTAPLELGGLSVGLAGAAEIIRIIARGEPSTALILAMQYINMANLPGSRWPRPLVERVVRDAVERSGLINALRVEPELGTPHRGGLPATIARRTAEGWSISGRKIYSTGIEGLRWAIVWARTDEEQPRVGGFLVPVPSPGLRIDRTWDPLGMRATGSHDVVLEDVAVPADYAADIRPPPEWVGETAQTGWFGILPAALYTGVAEAARDWLARFLKERVPTNLGAPLATLPRMQQALGGIEQLIATNRRLVRSAAADADAGRSASPVETGLIKIAATENAIAAVEMALKLTGNHGVSRHNPLERHHRDVLCGRIHTPQEDTAHLAAGRLALGL